MVQWWVVHCLLVLLLLPSSEAAAAAAAAAVLDWQQRLAGGAMIDLEETAQGTNIVNGIAPSQTRLNRKALKSERLTSLGQEREDFGQGL